MKTVITLFVFWVLSLGVIAQDQPTPFQDAILSSIAEINKNIAVINTRLATIDESLTRQTSRMDAFDAKLDGLTYTVATIQAVQKTTNKWLVMGIGILAPIIGYFFVVLRKLSPLAKVKDTYAFRPGNKPEFTRVRPKKRAKARPAA